MLKVTSHILFFSSIIFIILIGISFTNCKKGCYVRKDKNKGIIESEYEFGECFSNNSIVPSIRDSGFVISDDTTLQSVVVAFDLKYDKPECENTIPEAIDFSKNTLLGKYASGGCEVDFIREVTVDDASQHYIYTIKVLECGWCKKLQHSMNWVLVPKLPQEYTVEFIVK